MSQSRQFINDAIVKELTAGVIGAFIVFPIILNCGLIISQPMGSNYVMTGIVAAFSASILVTILRGIIFSAPLHLVSPKSTYAAMIATLLVGIANIPDIHNAYPTPESMAQMLFAVTFLCTILIGVFQIVLGLGKLGVLVKFVPYPVIAGFINGFSISLIIKQFPLMFGVNNWHQLLTTTHPLALTIGLIAFVSTLLATHFKTRTPAAFYGLVLGTFSFLIIKLFSHGDQMVTLIGAIPATLPVHPQVSAIADLVSSPNFMTFLPDILATVITISLIASLQSLISISGADALLGTRHNSNRELTTQGMGNLLSGALGGMPTGGSPSVTNLVIKNGGRTRIAYLAYAGILLAIALGLGQIIGMIPLPVMTGVVIASLFHQMDEWSLRLIRNLFTHKTHEKLSNELYFNLAIVVAVGALVFFFGALAALGGGMILAFGAFLRQISQSVVRRIVLGNQIRSRNSRPINEQKFLDSHMKKVVVVEIQGAVFFGSVDQVVQEMEVATKDCRIVIIDMKRVTDIDSSGVVTLERLDKHLARTNRILYLSYLNESRLIKALKEYGFDRIIYEQRIFEDTNAALSASEDFLLIETDFTYRFNSQHPLEKFNIFNDILPEDIAYLKSKMKRMEFSSGMKLVREGEMDNGMFFLVSGCITVSRLLEGRILRYASLRPGVTFGEIGLLTEGARTADVIADTYVICYYLSREDFYNFLTTHPKCGQQILIHMALNLATMVSSLSDIVRESEK